ncbi:TPA: viroplasmin family protein [Streptococcus suis]
MVKKYYAVRKGAKPGIYETWGEAEQQVKGFSGAEYKSFRTLSEADNYLLHESEDQSNDPSSIETMNEKINLEISELDDDSVLAFVDGSFSPKTNDGKEKYSYGVILLTKNAEYRLYKSFVDKEGLESRNVSGEIAGVKAAIDWAIEQQKTKIKIYYDYEGIEKWANGDWSAKKNLTKRYVEYINSSRSKIKIDFSHTPSHSGIRYNEQADLLAKAALNDKTYRTGNDGSVYIVGISIERWDELLDEIGNISGNELNFEIIDIKDGHKRIIIQLASDKVTINNYHNINSYIQGNSNTELFSRIVDVVISEVNDENKVVEVLNVYHALTITVEQIEREFTKLIPNYPLMSGDIKHKNMLLAAVYNTLLKGYMPDYTQLLHPTFRAMEYYLHRILCDKEGQLTTRKNKYGKSSNNFSFFSYDDTSKSYFYNSNCSLNPNELNYLNRLYNKYSQMRHPYSHTPALDIDVAIVTSITEARNLILDCLQLFNEYYIIFN